MDIGRPVEVVEVQEEPSVPYEGVEVSPEFVPEEAPQEAEVAQ